MLVTDFWWQSQDLRGIGERPIESSLLPPWKRQSLPLLLEADRAQVNPALVCPIWIGWLKKEHRGCVDFSGAYHPSIEFTDRDTEEPCLPYAEALVQLADEKFQVKAGSEDHVTPERLADLESKFASLQAGMDRLLKLHEKGDGGFQTPAEDHPAASKAASRLESRAKEKAKPSNLSAPPGLANIHSFPGLDPGTVAAALQAGVPRENLMQMSRVLKGSPGNLADFPRPQTGIDGVALTDDEDEAGEELGAQLTEPGNNSQMAAAVVKLTEIVAKMTKHGNSSSNPLEDALDQAGGSAGSGLGDVSSSMGRKHAAARRALMKAFQEDPAQIWRSIESNMAQDFGLQTTMPNASAMFSARGWCEHRSKIQPYIRTCRWVWGIAGIMDDLRLNRPDHARARAALLIAAAEQESLDRGSFLLSQEFLMEPAVPLSSFQGHALPDAVEMATTRLLDPRWIEAFADRLKQLDSYVEMRKKLTLKPGGSAAQHPNQENPSKGKGKSKGKKKSSDATEAGES